MRYLKAAAAFAVLMTMSLAQPDSADAQFGKLKDKVKAKVSEKVDKKIDCALGEVFKDGKCVAGSGSGSGSGSASGSASGSEKASTASPEKKNAMRPGQGAWANFDFVPGSKPLFVEDFTRDRVGNFPKRLELQDGNFEVVEWEGKRWLRSAGQGQFTINVPGGLPERWTLEMDLTIPYWGMYIYPGEALTAGAYPGDLQQINLGVSSTVRGKDSNKKTDFDVRSLFGRVFDICRENCSPEDIERGAATMEDQSLTRPFRLRVHQDGDYMKVYLDEVRVANMPNMGRWTGSQIHIQTRNNTNRDQVQGALFTNISLNAGGRDMYDALSADGRLALQGIYFDTGSDKIRPESSGTLAEIAAMMEEHGELKITIEGHTDNVGDAAANQKLSEARAAAVVSALSAAPYKVSADRLASAGFGASKPAKPNDTPENRQANRRVELVVQK